MGAPVRDGIDAASTCMVHDSCRKHIGKKTAVLIVASATYLQEVCLVARQVHVERLCKSIKAHLQSLMLEQQLFCPAAINRLNMCWWEEVAGRFPRLIAICNSLHSRDMQLLYCGGCTAQCPHRRVCAVEHSCSLPSSLSSL
jgi:hypothetical protein